jgi:outer membrane receptor protein involved in Fe transport
MRIFNSKNYLFITAVFIFVFTSLVFAQEQKKKDPFEMSFEELMNVKIRTAGKIPEQIRSIPASVVLITRKDIETYGYTTLAEILENIPGLYGIDDYTGDGLNLGVRGSWTGVPNKNIIILVNGVPQISDDQSYYPLVNIPIPVEAIDRLEVVRGPMSVIYGTGAFFGVINIITDDASTEPQNIASVSVGSQKTKKLFLRLEGGEGDIQYAVNASFRDTYGIDEPLSNMTAHPELLPLFFLVQPDHRTGGQLEGDRKYFNAHGKFKDIYLDLTYNESKQEVYFGLPSYSDGTSVQWSTTRVMLGYRKKLSDVLTIDGKFSYSHTRLNADFDWFFDDFYGIERIGTKAFEAGFDAFITPVTGLDIKAGLYYKAVLEAGDMFDLPSAGSPTLENIYRYLAEGDNIVTQAFFTQVAYKPVSNLELVAGVRLEQMPEYNLVHVQSLGMEEFTKIEGTYSQDKVEFIPRFAAVYSFNDRNIVKLLYGKAIMRPSFFQNTSNTLDPALDDLLPEWIQTLELNYITALSPKITLNASIFLNTLDNLVTRQVVFDEENNYTTWNDNADEKMVTTGVELTLQVRPAHGFFLELSGTYQQTEDRRTGDEDRDVAYSPNFLGYVKASYRHNKLTLALTGNYVGAMETFWDETIANDDGTFGNRIGEKVPGYFNLGANLRIEDFPAKGLYMSLRVSNLLDQEIRYPTFTNNSWADRGTIGHHRSFMVSVGWKF